MSEVPAALAAQKSDGSLELHGSSEVPKNTGAVKTSDSNPFEVAKELIEAKANVDAITEKLKEAKKQYAEINQRLLASMDSAEVSNLNIQGCTIYCNESLKVSASANEDLFKLLRDNGGESLVKESVHNGSLTSWCKDFGLDSETGLPMFPKAEMFNLLKCHVAREVRVRKA